MSSKKKEREKALEVGYFRSRNLSVFALFHLDKNDAALVLAHLEAVDTTFREKVNIRDFSKRFLPRGKFVFRQLWSYFVVIFRDSRLGLGSASFVERKIQAKKEDAAIEDMEHGSYVEVICFLMMIVSVKKKHFSHFLYWLVYETFGETKTRRGLVQMTSDLWKLDKQNLNKKDHESRKIHMTLVRNAAKHLETSALDMKAFQILDFRVQTALSIPVKSLQEEIMKKIANKAFWKKVTKEIQIVLDDPATVVPRMGEKKSTNETSKMSYRSNGDRKYAWFELRDFIENFFRFHEAAESIISEPTNVFQKIKRFIFKPTQKESKIVPVDLDNPVDGTGVSEYSLKDRVDVRLKWSVDKYYDEADINRVKAETVLEKCQEDLDEPLPELFGDEENEGIKMSNQDGDSASDDDSDQFIDKQYSQDSD